MVRTVAISFVCLIFLFSQISAADMVWQAQNSLDKRNYVW